MLICQNITEKTRTLEKIMQEKREFCKNDSRKNEKKSPQISSNDREKTTNSVKRSRKKRQFLSNYHKKNEICIKKITGKNKTFANRWRFRQRKLGAKAKDLASMR